MFYFLQKSLFQEFHEEKLIQTLERFGLKYDFCETKPFLTKLFYNKKNIPENNNVMLFGSVKTSHIIKDYNFSPGSFYNENHDFNIYSKHYGEYLLNHDSIIQKMIDPVNFEGDRFIRPTGDTKYFKGEIYNQKMWEYCLQTALTNNKNKKKTRVDFNSEIQIATLKEIYQEYRFFVVKGKVITGSTYKIGRRVVYQRCIDDDVINFAQQMVDIFQIADAFVIDICRTAEGMKIVECNCINCTGFYDIDIQKLIIALEENFSYPVVDNNEVISVTNF